MEKHYYIVGLPVIPGVPREHMKRHIQEAVIAWSSQFARNDPRFEVFRTGRRSQRRVTVAVVRDMAPRKGAHHGE